MSWVKTMTCHVFASATSRRATFPPPVIEGGHGIIEYDAGRIIGGAELSEERGDRQAALLAFTDDARQINARRPRQDQLVIEDAFRTADFLQLDFNMPEGEVRQFILKIFLELLRDGCARHSRTLLRDRLRLRILQAQFVGSDLLLAFDLGGGCPKFGGKLTFRPNLGYFSTCEKNWLREEYKGKKLQASEASDALDQGHSGGVTPTRTLHNAEPKGLQLIRSLVGRPNRQAIILLVYPAWSNGPGGGGGKIGVPRYRSASVPTGCRLPGSWAGRCLSFPLPILKSRSRVPRR